MRAFSRCRRPWAEWYTARKEHAAKLYWDVFHAREKTRVLKGEPFLPHQLDDVLGEPPVYAEPTVWGLYLPDSKDPVFYDFDVRYPAAPAYFFRSPWAGIDLNDLYDFAVKLNPYAGGPLDAWTDWTAARDALNRAIEMGPDGIRANRVMENLK